VGPAGLGSEIDLRLAPYGTIVVRVVGADGLPVRANVEVNGSGIESHMTDESGEARFYRTPGDWIVTIRGDDWRSAGHERATVVRADQVTREEFVLMAK
jgi:hypothetical protein